jgi:hypothetical protein
MKTLVVNTLAPLNATGNAAYHHKNYGNRIVA